MPSGTVSVPATALGARLPELRLKHKLSQFDLALKLGTRPNRVSDWETGRHDPSLMMLTRIAGLYGITSGSPAAWCDVTAMAGNPEDHVLDEIDALVNETMAAGVDRARSATGRLQPRPLPGLQPVSPQLARSAV